ncbi:phosphatidic acid phosphatase type 2/haloperoxidase [Tribonema minus]|uniref:Phosphatidic acid phosphatase type 2/haloperoxidase n=1 Tax=Tribonema minus TaxID=303371 RepID=A0A836CJ08_9STRA|nr:phosphatidic acid phosphatase type 2/haloperoxidase [Tribonema minus]
MVDRPDTPATPPLFARFLVVAFVALQLGRGFEIQLAVLGFGQMLDIVLNKTLKHVVHEARPTEFCANHGSGMPSHHSEFMFFFATWCSLFLANRLLINAVLLIWPIAVAVSRVYLTCHTVRQVVAGALVGSGFGALYYVVSDALVLRKRPLVRNLLLAQQQVVGGERESHNGKER